MIRVADGYEAQQRRDLTYAPFDTSRGLFTLCVRDGTPHAGNLPGSWTDPLTRKAWTLNAPLSAPHALAMDACAGLGEWHAPSLQELRAARARLTDSGLPGLNPQAGYWTSDGDANASYRPVMRLADGYEAQQRVDLSYAPFDTSQGLLGLCLKN